MGKKDILGCWWLIADREVWLRRLSLKLPPPLKMEKETKSIFGFKVEENRRHRFCKMKGTTDRGQEEVLLVVLLAGCLYVLVVSICFLPCFFVILRPFRFQIFMLWFIVYFLCIWSFDCGTELICSLSSFTVFEIMLEDVVGKKNDDRNLEIWKIWWNLEIWVLMKSDKVKAFGNEF